MSRPCKPVDWEMIERLASIGCTSVEIAYATGISKRTIERRGLEHLEAGRAKMRRSLRAKQFELAMAGDRTMLVWLGKQILGQRDEVKLDHGGTIAHVNSEPTEEQILAAAEEIRFKRLIGDVGPDEPARLRDGDISELQDE